MKNSDLQGNSRMQLDSALNHIKYLYICEYTMITILIWAYII